MKKLVTIFLAIAIIFAMSVTAFAADTAITINGETGRTYVGYKLLDVTTSHKTNVDCGDNHDKDCYNFAYTVVDKYKTILQNEVFANGTPTADKAKDVTKDEIVAYFAAQTSGDYGDFRVVADRIYNAIVDAGLGADKETFDGTGTVVQGYWMFADTTDLNGEEKANSFVMVDTAGETELEITPKTALPTITKEVLDKNDTANTEEWGISADYDVNDTVSFKLTATLPSNFASYKEYKLIFKDELSAAFSNASNIVVTMYDKDDNAYDVTNDFVKVENDNDFTLTCEDVKNIANVAATSTFVVTYDAQFNGTVVTGSTGNENKITLEFSNNPYTDSTGSISKSVKVYTYAVVINKVREDNVTPLAGAEFTLSKKNAEGEYDVIGTGNVSNDGTTFTWTGLDDGDYKVEETVVPAGYNKMTDEYFTISAKHDDKEITELKEFGEADLTNGTLTKTISNKAGTVLPETGGMGTMWLIFGGSMLVILAAVFMITRKKMSIYED